jgi:hypothetical protein
MKQVIDIKKSRVDNPEYRLEIMRAEQSILGLEAHIKQFTKNVKSQVDLAQGIFPFPSIYLI